MSRGEAKDRFYRRLQRVVAGALREAERAHGSQDLPGSVAKRVAAQLWALMRPEGHTDRKVWLEFIQDVLGEEALALLLPRPRAESSAPEGFYQCGCGYSHRDSYECLAQSTGELDFTPVNRYNADMKTNEKQTPARAYSAKLLQTRALLERLEAEVKHARQEPTWAAVGDLDHVASKLQDLVDSLAGEGEYAPENIAR